MEFTEWAVQSTAIISSFFYPAEKIGGTRIRRCQGIEVKRYGFTLGALALSPSDFCNATVSSAAFPLSALIASKLRLLSVPEEPEITKRFLVCGRISNENESHRNLHFQQITSHPKAISSGAVFYFQGPNCTLRPDVLSGRC
jgi:hypothetical protein